MALNSIKLGAIKEYIKRQFGDESGYQLTDEDIVKWANQAQMEIISKNKVLRSISTQTIPAEEYIFDKPEDSMQILSLRYDNSLMDSVGFDEFQSMGYPIDGVHKPEGLPSYWTMLGDKLMVGGISKDAATITLVYVPQPQQVFNDGDTLQLPDRYYDRILEFVMSKAYEMDENWDAHKIQRNLFEDNLLRLSNAELDSSGPYPTVIEYLYD